MRAQILNRKVHYWISVVVAVPLLIVICSGLLLQVKKHFTWIQPAEKAGSGGPPAITFDQILSISSAIPGSSITDWDDIRRIDFRPGKSLLKVTTDDGWEAQIDPSDGRVLQVAYRRSDLLEALHDGSWFGSAAREWIFLPAGVLLLVLWCTGLYLLLPPQLRRRRQRPVEPR